MLNSKNLPVILSKKGLNKKLLKICHENNVVFMALFGSFIRGEQKKKSDIDIAIRYEKGKTKTLFDLLDLEEQLKKLFRKKVDLGIYDTISPYIINEIKKEMRIIYEKR